MELVALGGEIEDGKNLRSHFRCRLGGAVVT